MDLEELKVMMSDAKKVDTYSLFPNQRNKDDRGITWKYLPDLDNNARTDNSDNIYKYEILLVHTRDGKVSSAWKNIHVTNKESLKQEYTRYAKRITETYGPTKCYNNKSDKERDILNTDDEIEHFKLDLEVTNDWDRLKNCRFTVWNDTGIYFNKNNYSITLSFEPQGIMSHISKYSFEVSAKERVY